jgi:hypothetical protein
MPVLCYNVVTYQSITAMQIQFLRIIFLVFCYANIALAQNERTTGMSFSGGFMTDSQGNIIKSGAGNNMPEGTPYLTEEWRKGHVIITGVRGFDLQRVRFNIVQNRLEYEYRGNTYEPMVSYRQFSINDMGDDGNVIIRNFKADFPAIDAQNQDTFYEVLYDGKVKLLRHYFVRINDYAEPLTMTKIKRFTKVVSLYIYDPQKQTFIKIPKKREALLSVFESKKEAITKFMKDAKIWKIIDENTFARVCAYYDSITT